MQIQLQKIVLVGKQESEFLSGFELMLILTAKLAGGLLASSQVTSTLIYSKCKIQQQRAKPDVSFYFNIFFLKISVKLMLKALQLVLRQQEQGIFGWEYSLLALLSSGVMLLSTRPNHLAEAQHFRRIQILLLEFDASAHTQHCYGLQSAVKSLNARYTHSNKATSKQLFIYYGSANS